MLTNQEIEEYTEKLRDRDSNTVKAILKEIDEKISERSYWKGWESGYAEPSY